MRSSLAADAGATALRDQGAHDYDHEYDDRLEADPAWVEAERLYKQADRVGMWVRFLRAGRGLAGVASQK